MRSMGKLIYSMVVSMDGYTEDEHGRFGWGAPEDEEVHSYINALASSLGAYLYGRRMYETILRYGVRGAAGGLALGMKSSEILPA
jgi:dihydrofolate reductase